MKVKGLVMTLKPRSEGKNPDSARGFSLIELMIVVAIAMAIAVAAMPAMVNVISSARMRGSMTNLTTFLQQTRGNAVRNNVFQSNYIGFANSEYFVFQQVSAVSDPPMSTAQELLPMGKQVIYMGTLTGSGAPSTLDTSIAFGSSSYTPNADALAWNTRGLPCSYKSTGVDCTKGFIWYFTFQPPWGSSRWAALSVSPAGRIKSWYWDGGAWTN
jgi:prepilin-type N-terminal cleavage/methylation domain-containing protein